MSDSSIYEQTTRAISISVEPMYLDDQSSPEDNHYVWAYRVQIENLGNATVQLVSRHWKITDSQGHTQEVRGDGVVGEQPVLDPGDSFEYTSGTPLATPSGFMSGSYQMVVQTGERFDAVIPPFSLDGPHQSRPVH
jgi:ApaG protein